MLTSMRGAVAAGLTAASLVAGVALTATPAFAQQDTTSAPADAAAPAEKKSEITVTGNVALTTDYRFRGVSLSGGDPAIQGGITVTHASGFYVGTWSSSIRGGSVYGEQELDLFGGWSGEVTPGITLDGGLLYYVYPGGHVGDANYFEPYASVSGTVGPAKLKVGVAYAWKQDSLGDDDNLYVYGNVDIGIPSTPLTFSAHVGYADGVQAPDFLAGGSDKSGIDYSAGISATIYGPLSASVAYVGTSGRAVDSLTNDAIVGTLTAAF